MTRVHTLLVGITLSVIFMGCGGGDVKPTPEQQDPEYGKSALEKMKSMGVTPKAAKGTGS